MRRLLRIGSLATLTSLVLPWLTASMLMFACLGACGRCHSADTAAAQGADTRIHECPMLCVKPGDTRPYTHVGPGDCVVCGMHLVPRAVQPPATKR